MEQRITSLLLPAPEAELEASCKELDEKITWLLHNSRKMDNYLELEPFSKDGRPILLHEPVIFFRTVTGVCHTDIR